MIIKIVEVQNIDQYGSKGTITPRVIDQVEPQDVIPKDFNGETKRKIPNEFKCNGFEFKRMYLSISETNYVDSMRRNYREDGYYTKVRKYEGKPVLYVSKKRKQEAEKNPSIIFSDKNQYSDNLKLKYDLYKFIDEYIRTNRYVKNTSVMYDFVHKRLRKNEKYFVNFFQSEDLRKILNSWNNSYLVKCKNKGLIKRFTRRTYVVVKS